MSWSRYVRNLLACLWATAAPCLCWAAAEPVLIRHNFFMSEYSSQLNYKGEVLTLLLEKSKDRFGPYVLQKGPHIGWSQNRAYRELERGNLDLISSMTNEAREATGIPIRYCLYKGLLGVRIGMGSKASVQQLESVATWEALTQVRMGLVFDWPDYTIQTDAGLKVLRLPSLDSSLERLRRGTFQLMPMGVVEVGPMAKKYDLATISNWAISYPTAYYFFVSKSRPELAERLNYGFEQAIKDRSFELLFDKRIGPLIAEAALDKRQVFHLKNASLPKATALHRKELWHPIVLHQLH